MPADGRRSAVTPQQLLESLFDPLDERAVTLPDDPPAAGAPAVDPVTAALLRGDEATLEHFSRLLAMAVENRRRYLAARRERPTDPDRERKRNTLHELIEATRRELLGSAGREAAEQADVGAPDAGEASISAVAAVAHRFREMEQRLADEAQRRMLERVEGAVTRFAERLGQLMADVEAGRGGTVAPAAPSPSAEGPHRDEPEGAGPGETPAAASPAPAAPPAPEPPAESSADPAAEPSTAEPPAPHARRHFRAVAEIEAEGLAGAMASLLRWFEEKSGIACYLDPRVTVEPPAEVGDTAEGLVGEILSELRMEAQAEKIAVTIECSDEGLLARVQDDAKGSDPLLPEDPVESNGLASVRRRAEFEGGWLEAQRIPGAGTTVQLWLPLEADFA